MSKGSPATYLFQMEIRLIQPSLVELELGLSLPFIQKENDICDFQNLVTQAGKELLHIFLIFKDIFEDQLLVPVDNFSEHLIVRASC